MYFDELIKHLYQIKLFTYLEKNSLTIFEYLQSIADIERLKTEHSLKAFDYDIKTVNTLCNQSAKASLNTYQDEETGKIILLLNKAGFEEPLFGSVISDLKEIFQLLQKNEFDELRLYVLGKSKEELKQFFGANIFNKNYKNLKSDEEIFNCYIEIVTHLVNLDFALNLRLLETVKSSLKESVQTAIEEFCNALKNKVGEEKNNYIKEVHNSYLRKFDSTPYLVVSKVANFDYLNLSELSKFLFPFFKTNNINPNNFDVEQNEIVRSISCLLFITYIENEFPFVQTIQLNRDVIFAIIQNKSQLIDVINPDYIESFSKIEYQLIDEVYFDSAGKWIKEKKCLTEFIIHCIHCGYIKYRKGSDDDENKKYLAIRRFFETRYSIEIENQFKPNQRKKITYPVPTFRWITIVK